jgi:hypothetical protein
MEEDSWSFYPLLSFFSFLFLWRFYALPNATQGTCRCG